jgi:hypothetical protein
MTTGRMVCSQCGFVPDESWRWCPDCGATLRSGEVDTVVDLVAADVGFCVDWSASGDDRYRPGRHWATGHSDSRDHVRG